uniref:Interferon-related developmental regulator N-terminal domain-containing protein n=1 Tax=Nicotiana tabacum TaxID=4097 RepID=A0A1S3Y8Q1_TOBAC|nr:PREDICTED: uncharacterized protein LOC107773623 [Nicotiana tabacum]
MKNQRFSRPQNRKVSPIGGDASAATKEKQGSIQIPKKKLYPYLQELYKKKSSRRENALKTLVEEFETNVRYEFAQNNFVTLVHRCQNCMKLGSALEIDLALQLIGLVVLTLVGQSVRVFVNTLVAARDFVDTERSMEIIWQFMNQETKHSTYVTAAAISAWALLLSDINTWRIGHKKWKELIPYLLKQLEEGDEDVTAASINALALIFEKGNLEKFSNQTQEYSSTKDMKDDMMKHVKRAKQDASKILEDDYNKTATITLCGRRLTFSTWTQLKQMNYIRRFLGYGFTNHMMENKYLHELFHFVPAAMRYSGLELYKSEYERKRIYMSPNSLLNKGKTQLMNKYRSIAKEAKAGHYNAEGELD